MVDILKVIFSLIILPHLLLAQKQANIWYFGNQAGLDFNSGNPVALTDGTLTQLEGCASLADTGGNLLFYTNGLEIVDASHMMMPNGDSLYGNSSSSQSSIITPVLNNPNQYYVFTADGFSCAVGDPGPKGRWDGLNYSIVDMTLPGNGTIANPLGDVIPGFKNINLTDSIAEKVTAVKHAKEGKYWIVTKKEGNQDVYAYLVDSSGIDTTPIISQIANFASNTIGTMKSAHNGTALAICTFGFFGSPAVHYADFDNCSGVVSNHQIIQNVGAYGVSFSPNDSLIYVSGGTTLRQYKRFSANISSTLKTYNVSVQNLQLGPDKKLYLASPGLPSLSTVNNPNSYDDPGIQVNSVSLAGRTVQYGLPNFFNAYVEDGASIEFFNASNLCLGDETKFLVGTSIANPNWFWDFGDAATLSDTSNLSNPTYTYADTGSYLVTAIASGNCVADTFLNTVSIKIAPVVDLGADTFICPINDTIRLDAENSNLDVVYTWSTGDTTQLITATSPGKYYVTLELDGSDCADSDTITIDLIMFAESIEDTCILLGGSIALTANLDSSHTYSWTPGNTLDDSLSGMPVATPMSSTRYIMFINDTLHNCTATDSVYINVNEFQLLSGDSIICEGDSVIIKGNINDGLSFAWTPTDYLQTPNELFSTSIPEQSVTYYFSALDTTYRCNYIDSLRFLVVENPVVDLGEDTMICHFDSLELVAPSGMDIYSWSNGSSNTSIVVKQANKYILILEKGPCIVSDSINLLLDTCLPLLDIPSAFSPNGDGINDRFEIFSSLIKELEFFKIYDRWGKLVFETNQLNRFWDGTFNNKPLEVGVYLASLRATAVSGEPHEVLNHKITLIR